jgi:hypothetical protein
MGYFDAEDSLVSAMVAELRDLIVSVPAVAVVFSPSIATPAPIEKPVVAQDKTPGNLARSGSSLIPVPQRAQNRRGRK